MKKHFKRRKNPALKDEGQDLSGVLGRMQEHLTAMEKKIDILMARMPEKKSGEGQDHRPFHHFDRPRHHDRQDRDNNFRDREFTQVTCADCGRECEVPFKPTADRPVYCKECFSKHKSRDQFQENTYRKPKEQFFPGKRDFDEPRGRDSYGPRKRTRSILKKRRNKI